MRQNYHKIRTVEECVQLLRESGDNPIVRTAF